MQDQRVVDALLATRRRIPRVTLARNPHTPVSVLRQLAQSKHADVLAALAKNPAAPADLLADLASRPDEDGDIRRALVRNANTPDAVVHAIVAAAPNDIGTGRDVRDAASRRPTLTDATALLLAGSLDAARGLLNRSDLPGQVIHEILATVDGAGSAPVAETVRALAGRHRNTFPDDLARLAHDTSKAVLAAVAGNPSTPPANLADLLEWDRLWTGHEEQMLSVADGGFARMWKARTLGLRRGRMGALAGRDHDGETAAA